MKSIFKPMKFSVLLLMAFTLQATSQTINGKQLLEKAINYHDPNGQWPTFDGTLNVTMETPNSPNRDSEIMINLPDEHFYMKAVSDTIITEYTVKKEECTIRLNGLSDLSEEQLKTHRLSCERANMYKNYYTYLYGLPMKLKDPGTKVHETVALSEFKGKEYLVLKVSYDESVGSDVWFFYFSPQTYAMEVYQFFKTDASGKLKPDTGEYILLSRQETINDIKMPKTRAWYYNKDDKYLGTDILHVMN